MSIKIKFRDILATIVIVITLTALIFSGVKGIEIPREIIGAIVSWNSIILQFYFRKKPKEEKAE